MSIDHRWTRSLSVDHWWTRMMYADHRRTRPMSDDYRWTRWMLVDHQWSRWMLVDQNELNRVTLFWTFRFVLALSISSSSCLIFVSLRSTNRFRSFCAIFIRLWLITASDCNWIMRLVWNMHIVIIIFKIELTCFVSTIMFYINFSWY